MATLRDGDQPSSLLTASRLTYSLSSSPAPSPAPRPLRRRSRSSAHRAASPSGPVGGAGPRVATAGAGRSAPCAAGSAALTWSRLPSTVRVAASCGSASPSAPGAGASGHRGICLTEGPYAFIIEQRPPAILVNDYRQVVGAGSPPEVVTPGRAVLHPAPVRPGGAARVELTGENRPRPREEPSRDRRAEEDGGDGEVHTQHSPRHATPPPLPPRHASPPHTAERRVHKAAPPHAASEAEGAVGSPPTTAVPHSPPPPPLRRVTGATHTRSTGTLAGRVPTGDDRRTAAAAVGGEVLPRGESPPPATYYSGQLRRERSPHGRPDHIALLPREVPPPAGEPRAIPPVEPAPRAGPASVAGAADAVEVGRRAASSGPVDVAAAPTGPAPPPRARRRSGPWASHSAEESERSTGRDHRGVPRFFYDDIEETFRHSSSSRREARHRRNAALRFIGIDGSDLITISSYDSEGAAPRRVAGAVPPTFLVEVQRPQRLEPPPAEIVPSPTAAEPPMLPPRRSSSSPAMPTSASITEYLKGRVAALTAERDTLFDRLLLASGPRHSAAVCLAAPRPDGLHHSASVSTPRPSHEPLPLPLDSHRGSHRGSHRDTAPTPLEPPASVVAKVTVADPCAAEAHTYTSPREPDPLALWRSNLVHDVLQRRPVATPAAPSKVGRQALGGVMTDPPRPAARDQRDEVVSRRPAEHPYHAAAPSATSTPSRPPQHDGDAAGPTIDPTDPFARVAQELFQRHRMAANPPAAVTPDRPRQQVANFYTTPRRGDGSRAMKGGGAADCTSASTVSSVVALRTDLGETRAPSLLMESAGDRYHTQSPPVASSPPAPLGTATMGLLPPPPSPPAPPQTVRTLSPQPEDGAVAPRYLAAASSPLAAAPRRSVPNPAAAIFTVPGAAECCRNPLPAPRSESARQGSGWSRWRSDASPAPPPSRPPSIALVPAERGGDAGGSRGDGASAGRRVHYSPPPSRSPSRYSVAASTSSVMPWSVRPTRYRSPSLLEVRERPIGVMERVCILDAISRCSGSVPTSVCGADRAGDHSLLSALSRGSRARWPSTERSASEESRRSSCHTVNHAPETAATASALGPALSGSATATCAMPPPAGSSLAVSSVSEASYASTKSPRRPVQSPWDGVKQPSPTQPHPPAPASPRRVPAGSVMYSESDDDRAGLVGSAVGAPATTPGRADTPPSPSSSSSSSSCMSSESVSLESSSFAESSASRPRRHRHERPRNPNGDIKTDRLGRSRAGPSSVAVCDAVPALHGETQPRYRLPIARRRRGERRSGPPKQRNSPSSVATKQSPARRRRFNVPSDAPPPTAFRALA